MDKTRLAACQKRLKTWQEFLDSHYVADNVRTKTIDLMKEYRNLLTKCWENDAISSNDLESLTNLERRLESLNEHARLRTS